MHKKTKRRLLLLFALCLDEFFFFFLSTAYRVMIPFLKTLSFMTVVSSCICITAGAKFSFMLKKKKRNWNNTPEFSFCLYLRKTSAFEMKIHPLVFFFQQYMMTLLPSFAFFFNCVNFYVRVRRYQVPGTRHMLLSTPH